MKEIDNLMQSSKTCVLATVNKQGLPEAATVGFSHNKNYELLIGTTTKTRKYKNLMSNPNVAAVVGFEKPITVQYEGTASLISGQNLEERLEKHYQKVPGAKFYSEDKDQVYFLVKPKWMRYTNIMAEPEIEVVEITDFGVRS